VTTLEEHIAPIIVDIYCRVSTDPQEDNTSLDEQETVSRQYCTEHNLIVGMVHREVFSGYQYREREKLELMRQRYREGKIQGIVIRTLDRLSRSQVHNAILMDEMEHHTTSLYCVKENIDDTSMGKFVRMVLAFVAEMEREKIMDRSTTGRINKAREGKLASGTKPPYGWTWNDPAKKDALIVDETQAAVIRWAAEEYANGTSAVQIVRTLEERSIPSPSNGERWNRVHLRRILSNERLTGKNAKIFAYQKHKAHRPLEAIDLPDGTYPAIISEELFLRVQERLVRNKQESQRNNRQPERFLLRAGHIQCAMCQRFMVVHYHGAGAYQYRCTKNNTHGDVVCLGQDVSSKKVDEWAWQRLQQLADHIKLIEKAIKLATNASAIEADTKAIEASIATWKRKAINYLTDLDDDTLQGDSRASIRKAMNDANLMVEKLETERAKVMIGMIDKEREKKAYQDILQWCKKVKGAREELTYQLKRDFLKLLGIIVLVNAKAEGGTSYKMLVTLPEVQALLPSTGDFAKHLPTMACPGAVPSAY
jgi:site-specific DNA recombinase